ncbi:hypothetical protein RSOLAG22IIIB_10074 [Rhizoctonia solani]|uniref:Uncharacterized protein n=1 Tax=Rhizoctonia solani TaxID=456999 RepID=A0A0K6G1G2_9AGAM|nr:hypothetical protein RSOLAG22IIIB_10074 [Rhizoctonia solani]
MPASGSIALVPHHYRPLPLKPMTSLPRVRSRFYVPEAAPLIGVVLCSLGMGIYLGQTTARRNDLKWRLRTQSWLRPSSRGTRWDDTNGLRETIQKELRNCIDNWNWVSMSLDQV